MIENIKKVLEEASKIQINLHSEAAREFIFDLILIYYCLHINIRE